tara:strand:+ start:61 stop:435 length:375 start_codon:yes stop_codon:yes gene_type:complete
MDETTIDYEEVDEYEEYNEVDEYDISDIIINENNEDINIIMKNYKKKLKNYKTTPTLTKYEKTKVLSERANQINYGSNILIENSEKYSNAYDIAVAEMNENKIPFIIKRPYGNHYEYWKLKDLL